MVDSGKIDNIIPNMKNKIKLTLNQFLLVFAGLILFNFTSCAVEEVSSENTKVNSELIIAAKNFVEIEMHKNANNAFLTSLPLTADWEHVFVGKDGAIRVPMLSNDSSQDSFELFITKKSGKFAGKIIQFMPFDKPGKTGYHRILFSLAGKRETDLLIPKSFILNLQNKMGYKSGIKSTGKTNNEDFPYLCGYFRDQDGNPAEFVTLQFCPDGTLFNSFLEVCDWPSDAGINARKSFFKIVFSNDEVRHVSTYGFLEELEEVPVENNYHDPGYVPDDSSPWINFPPNFNFPSYPGGGNGEDYYPIGGLPTVTTKAQELRSQLNLTTSQFNWIKERPEIANSLFDYLYMNSFGAWADIFALEMINQMMQNPGLVLDAIDSYQSPFNIDKSAISTSSPEGMKFNTLYSALKNSSQFKALFLDIFDGDQTRFNVKFEINEHVYEDNNPANKEVNATTTKDPITNIITIKINKQILIAGTGKSQTNIENAKTILHECIHAYLFVKSDYATIGMDIKGTINTMYPSLNEQHEFMYGKMIPVMQNVLSEIRNSVTTPAKRGNLEQYTMHPTQNPLTSEVFNWSDFYLYLSLNGLQDTYCFIIDFPYPSDKYSLYKQYIDAGSNELDR